MLTFVKLPYLERNIPLSNFLITEDFNYYVPILKVLGEQCCVVYQAVPTMDNKPRIYRDMPRMCEFIKGRFYFSTIPQDKPIPRRPDVHFFCTDEQFVYSNYYSDFGPLNLGLLYRYCETVNSKLLKCEGLECKKIVHYTSQNPQKRANAAFLVASYGIIYLNMKPDDAYRVLLTEKGPPFRPFQDACPGVSRYHITLKECLSAIYKGLQCGFFNFDDFSVEAYERYESFRHGDINWIVPSKLLAFCGPVAGPSTYYKPPEYYINYFKQNNVSTVVRLNKKFYDSKSFTDAGFKHYDLFIVDGGTPTRAITEKFLSICETTNGAVAVHCKAGLGRTGSLIGAYIIKHFRMNAHEAIAWMRICRPGSVIGRQQTWLECMELCLWNNGDIHRQQQGNSGDSIPRCLFGIYSIEQKEIENQKNKLQASLPPAMSNQVPQTLAGSWKILSVRPPARIIRGRGLMQSALEKHKTSDNMEQAYMNTKKPVGTMINPRRIVGTHILGTGSRGVGGDRMHILSDTEATERIDRRLGNRCPHTVARFHPHVSHSLGCKDVRRKVPPPMRAAKPTQGDNLNAIKTARFISSVKKRPDLSQ